MIAFLKVKFPEFGDRCRSIVEAAVGRDKVLDFMFEPLLIPQSAIALVFGSSRYMQSRKCLVGRYLRQVPTLITTADQMFVRSVEEGTCEPSRGWTSKH